MSFPSYLQKYLCHVLMQAINKFQSCLQMASSLWEGALLVCHCFSRSKGNDSHLDFSKALENQLVNPKYLMGTRKLRMI